MIERFFRRALVRRRLEQGPLAGVIGNYLGHLVQRGYSKHTVRQYVQSLEHFAGWLLRSGVEVADADAAAVERFLARHLPRCRCRAPRNCTTRSVRAALRLLLAALDKDRRSIDQDGLPRAVNLAVADFERHLIDTCGIAPATRRYYLREVRSFLSMRFGTRPVDLVSITVADVRAFAGNRGRNPSPASTNVVVTAVRSFVPLQQALRRPPATHWGGANGHP